MWPLSRLPRAEKEGLMLGSLLDLILPRALFIREGRGVKQEVGARNVTGEKPCEVSLFCLSGLSGSSGVCGVLNQ